MIRNFLGFLGLQVYVILLAVFHDNMAGALAELLVPTQKPRTLIFAIVCTVTNCIFAQRAQTNVRCMVYRNLQVPFVILVTKV